MNGIPSTSASFGSQHLSSAVDPSLSFLSNPMGISFFGNSNYGTPNQIFNKGSNSLSSDAAANTYIGSSASDSRQLDALWGIGDDNPIIDDDQKALDDYDASKSDPSFNYGPGEESAAIDTDIPIETGIAEGAEIASAGTPWGLAALINQQVGQSVNSAITTGQENISSQDYMSNINQHGVNVGLNASLIQNQQQQTIKAGSAGGGIGSIFGPLGALIGHAVAGTVQANPDLFNTAASSSGWINPTDTTAANSASAAAPTGDSTMQDNVD
ncbi:hypothetical protein [Lasius niger virus 1]|uniref:Uncharacterized protein n=1 Tax=Lasius niger virus 1 TaxID=2018503 RepID=A0A220QTH0_9VIRU|nr:hypothetical protein [Lasius niger virus 1]ASK12209.1 hypothetical protein [Lasius niger virus 1]